MGVPDTDLLVIGAGIQGVGVAQAAAAAGYRVTLLEARHPAAGTSSKSSKLIHGGLRYLESFELSLVRESLAERRILREIAPHLVRLVPFYIPVYRETTRSALKIRAGLSLYALLGNLRPGARFEAVPRERWESLDGIRTEGLRRVFRYQDGQTDDAALCRAVAESASELGAAIHSGTEVVGGEREEAGWRVRYRIEGEVHDLSARVVVNAGGPWANQVLDRFTSPPPRRAVELVGGTHLELEGEVHQGIYYLEAPADRRAVFVIPWKGRTMVGTTETPFTGDPSAYGPTGAECDYLMETFANYFPDRADAPRLEAWAGLRVLPRGDGRAFERSREVVLAVDERGRPSFLTIYGGKLTGYRATAEKVLRKLRPALPAAERRADTATLRLPEDPGGSPGT